MKWREFLLNFLVTFATFSIMVGAVWGSVLLLTAYGSPLVTTGLVIGAIALWAAYDITYQS